MSVVNPDIDPFYSVYSGSNSVDVEEELQRARASRQGSLRNVFPSVAGSASAASTSSAAAANSVQAESIDFADIYGSTGGGTERGIKHEENELVKSMAAVEHDDQKCGEILKSDSYDLEEDEDRDHFDPESINNGSPHKEYQRRRSGQWMPGDPVESRLPAASKLSLLIDGLKIRYSGRRIGGGSEGTEADAKSKARYHSQEALDLMEVLNMGFEAPAYVKAASAALLKKPSTSSLKEELQALHQQQQESAQAATVPNTEVKSIKRGGRITRPDGDDESVTSTISASSIGSRNRLSHSKSPGPADRSRLTAENIARSNSAQRSTTPTTGRKSAASPSPMGRTGRSTTPTNSGTRSVSASRRSTSRDPIAELTVPQPRKAALPSFGNKPAAASTPRPTTSLSKVLQGRSTTPSAVRSVNKTAVSVSSANRSTTPTATSRLSAGTASSSNRSSTPTTLNRSSSSLSMRGTAASSARSTTPNGTTGRSTTPSGGAVRSTTPSATGRSTTPSATGRSTTPNTTAGRSTTPNGTNRASTLNSSTGRSTTPTLTTRAPSSSSNLTAGRSTTPTLTRTAASSSSNNLRTGRSTTPTNTGRPSLTSASPARSTTPNALMRSSSSVVSTSSRSTTPSTLNRQSSAGLSSSNRSTTPTGTGLSRYGSSSSMTSKLLAPSAMRPAAAQGLSKITTSSSSSSTTPPTVSRTGSSQSLRSSVTPSKPTVAKTSSRTPSGMSSGASVVSVQSSATSASKRSVPSTPTKTVPSTPPAKTAVASTPVKTTPSTPVTKSSPLNRTSSSNGLPPVSPAIKLNTAPATPTAITLARSNSITANATLMNPHDHTLDDRQNGKLRSRSRSDDSADHHAGGIPQGVVAIVPGARGGVYMPSLTHSSSTAILKIYGSSVGQSQGHNSSFNSSFTGISTVAGSSLASHSRDTLDSFQNSAAN